MNSEIVFNIDQDEATIFVMKVFDTTPSEVWKYFTQSDLLSLWWAPKPWKIESKNFDFQPGGKWLYAMVGPEGEKHFAGMEYSEITTGRSFSCKDYFTDENGVLNTEFPSANWLIGFTGVEEGTKLTLNFHFLNAKELNQTLEMGFEEGFKMVLNQLEDILEH